MEVAARCVMEFGICRSGREGGSSGSVIFGMASCESGVARQLPRRSLHAASLCGESAVSFPSAHDALSKLNPREERIAHSRCNQEVGRKLNLKEKTVKHSNPT